MRLLTRSTISIAALACVFHSVSALAQAAQAPVDLELVTEPGFPITGAHQWSRALGKLELGAVRIRGMQAGDSPKITNRGTAQRPSYHVLGALTAQNRLRLPEATYGLGDLAQLKTDLTNLQKNQEKQNASPKVAFGLTADELQAVRQSLRPTVSFDTKKQPPAEVVRRIAEDGKFNLHWAPEASASLARAEPTYDNVQNVSSGAALATILRPYGLILEPRKEAGAKIELWIAPASKDSLAWPIGWPSEKQDADLLPVLMEFLNAEIDKFTLTETLTALQPRVKAPLLLDHNALAKHSIEPDKATIVIPPKRTYYKSLLRKVLFQARLKSEIRVDEAQQPLIWITTIKK